jgi:hypothetical protein
MNKTLASFGVALAAVFAVTAASATTARHETVRHETIRHEMAANVVTEGYQVLGADPDAHIRYSLVREGDAGAGTN